MPNENTRQLMAEYNIRARAAGRPAIRTFRGSKIVLRARIKSMPAAEPQTIADFMRLHDIDPRRGRAALRRSGRNAPYNPSDPELRRIVTSMGK